MPLFFMSYFQKEKDMEFEALGLKDQSKSLSVLKQVGRSNVAIDSKREALVPGKRISSSGKIYWETRKNRSDQVGKTV